MRLKQSIAQAFQRYLELGGGALPGCPCMIHHTLGVLGAEYLATVLPPKPRR
ncbi:MAG: hypothetical protein ACLQAT_27395 [Candidatus Binataceae bacterium]